jgi:hypothetical protein
MTRPTVAAVALSLLARPAGAQVVTPDSSVTFTLHWSDELGNNNGLLEPGESALLWIDASFTNQNGLANVSPPIGTFGAGTIRGLGWGQFDLAGAGGAEGQWNVAQAAGYGVDPTWDLTSGSGNGEPVHNGARLSLIQFGQFPTTPQAILTTNPILKVWRGVWTPNSYSARQVTFATGTFFSTDEQPGAVCIQLSPTIVALALITWPGLLHFGSVAIPIVPAPPALVVLGALLVRGRRRLRTC